MSLAEKQAAQKKAVVEYFRSLPVLKHAAASAHISRETLDRWRKSDPEFEAELLEASATFFNMKGKKARPEFMLERLDKETFSPPTQKHDIAGDAVGKILEGFGLLSEGQKNDRKTDEAAEGTSSQPS